MKNKTFNDFLKNYSTAPELHLEAWRQSTISWEEFKARPSKFASAKNDRITGFIYFSDKVQFTKNNYSLITEMLLNDFYFNTGYFDKIKEYRPSKARLYNYLAMITWELLAYELTEYLNN